MSLRTQLSKAGVGRLIYRAWHAPAAWLRQVRAEGGPVEYYRTTAGRRAMTAAAARLSPPATVSGPPLEVHLLTGKRFWDQTAFCLYSFAVQSDRALAPVLYDDGSLTAENRQHLGRLFPATRFVTPTELNDRLDRMLPSGRYPHLRDRWQNYPNIRKLIAPHLGSTGWKLVLDSDLLFFHSPTLLVNWLAAPAAPLHAVDIEQSYGYSDDLLAKVAGRPLPTLLNVGLCGLCSDNLDWDQLESYCRTLILAEKTSYYLEQALVAMLVAGVDCVVAPASDYVTLPRPPEALECRAVMHHYVADSKKWYFRHNWRKVANPAFQRSP